MKKLFMILPLVLVLCFVYGCQKGEEVAEEPAGDTEIAIEAATALYKEFVFAANSSDAARFADVFTDDAIRIPADRPIIKGKEVILEDALEFYEEFTEKAKIEVLDAHMFGGMISARGTWANISTPKDGGEPRNINGNWISILKKQSDGAWKIMWDIWTLEQLIDPWNKE